MLLRSLAMFAAASLGLCATGRVASAEDKNVAAPMTICFLPLGPQDDALLAIAQRGSAYLYGAQTRQLKPRALPKKAYYKPRHRYQGEKLLDFLDAAAAALPAGESCDVMVGITTVDISTTKGSHKDWGILGLGTIGGAIGGGLELSHEEGGAPTKAEAPHGEYREPRNWPCAHRSSRWSTRLSDERCPGHRGVDRQRERAAV